MSLSSLSSLLIKTSSKWSTVRWTVLKTGKKSTLRVKKTTKSFSFFHFCNLLSQSRDKTTSELAQDEEEDDEED